MNRVWSDEPCDRTEGHKGVAGVFFEWYGFKLEDWKKAAGYFDGGDAMYWIGYIDKPEKLIRVEVVIACDGDAIREYSR